MGCVELDTQITAHWNTGASTGSHNLGMVRSDVSERLGYEHHNTSLWVGQDRD
jgi:hypothetical protein